MADINELKDRLAKLIIEKGALKFGDFTLASGKKSDYYIDGRIIGLTPEGAHLVGAALHAIVAEKYPAATAIGGLIAGAVPPAVAASVASRGTARPLDAFMVRKEIKKHGTQRAVEGPVAPGARVVVVDDVITTGGSTLEAIRKVEEFGCLVEGVVCLVDREDEKAPGLAKYAFTPVLTITELRKYRKQ